MDHVFLFDWGDTLMRDDPAQHGPMRLWPQVSALPGALEMLEWLHASGRVGIASGASDSDASDIRAALARVGLDRFIDVIFCSRSLGLSKTDPLFWQAIIDSLKIPAARIIMVGDSFEADVATSQAAGIRAIWFNWRDLPARPCPTIKSLQELPRLIQAIC